MFSCIELVEDIERVLSYRHLRKYNIDIRYALKITKAVTVNHALVYPIKKYIPTDANDNYIIALALQTASGFVISGNSDILSAKKLLERKFRKLKIITKAAFESKFKNK